MLSVVAAAASLVSPVPPAVALEVTVPAVKLPAEPSPPVVNVPVPGVNLRVGAPAEPSLPAGPAQPAAPSPRALSGAGSAGTTTEPPARSSSSAGNRRQASAAVIQPPPASVGTSGAASRAAPLPPPQPSAVDRIVERIPSWILAALSAALLAAVAFALVWMRERRRARQARHDALVDPLTGIPNRLAFFERLSHEWGRARRYRRDLGLILLDMDGLKQLNDGQGHIAGDRALTSIAQTISCDIRQSDLAARLAGDEFVVLCPETSGEGLRLMGDKLRVRLDAEGVGTSVGVAEFDLADRSPEDLLARADDAMYRDKESRHLPRRERATARPDLASSATPAFPAS